MVEAPDALDVPALDEALLLGVSVGLDISPLDEAAPDPLMLTEPDNPLWLDMAGPVMLEEIPVLDGAGLSDWREVALLDGMGALESGPVDGSLRTPEDPVAVLREETVVAALDTPGLLLSEDALIWSDEPALLLIALLLDVSETPEPLVLDVVCDCTILPVLVTIEDALEPVALDEAPETLDMPPLGDAVCDTEAPDFEEVS